MCKKERYQYPTTNTQYPTTNNQQPITNNKVGNWVLDIGN
jgi:hypothetical protein